MIDVLAELRQQRGCVTLVAQKLGRGAAVHTAVQRNNPRRHAVYGAELHPRRQLRPEFCGKAAAHFIGGSRGVGHCQDAPRRDAADPGHIAQPGNQHGSFATARHRQQQHRAVDGLHRGPLLGIQRRHMGGFKGGFVHSAAPSFIE